MKFARRNLLHLAAGAVALRAVSRPNGNEAMTVVQRGSL